MLRTHCQTSGWSLTAQDPYNNIVRTTMECLSAALGGTQSLHTNSFDEAMGLPTDFSARIARNTQLIVQEESQITRVADPLAGSYYIESLTSSLVEEAQKIIDEVEHMGGMIKAIEEGMPKRKIEESSARRQARIDQGRDVILGVNKYTIEENETPEILEVSAAVREEQIFRLKKLRESRDNTAVEKSLRNLTFAAENGDNLLEAAVPAARLRATVGEISDALEKVFGRYVASSQCIEGIYAAEYGDDDRIKALIDRTALFEKKHGRRPRILLVKMGQDGHDRGIKAIATAYRDFGFDIILGPLFQTACEAAQMAIENEVDMVGVSSLAAGHKTLIPKLIEELQEQNGSGILVAAGGVIPVADYPLLLKAGAVAIFGPGTAIPESADRILKAIEKHYREAEPS